MSNVNVTKFILKENSLFYTLENMRSLMPFHVGNVSVLVDNNSHLVSSKNHTELFVKSSILLRLHFLPVVSWHLKTVP